MVQDTLNLYANNPSFCRVEYPLTKRFSNIRRTFAA